MSKKIKPIITDKPHHRFEQLDMFIADKYFPKIKHDIYTMEHQVFNLSKKKCIDVIDYEHNGTIFKVIPSGVGLPFIRDSDILTYCGSQIMAALNRGEVPSRLVRVRVRDYAIATNRSIGGKLHSDFLAQLRRLRGAFVETNVPTGEDQTLYKSFSWIEDYEVIETIKNRKTKEERKDTVSTADILLSKWQYNALLNNEVLTLDNDYYKIKNPTQIAIYLCVRKHINQQGKWMIGALKLKKKINHRGHDSSFIRTIKNLSAKGFVGKYTIKIDTKNNITFYNQSAKGLLQSTKDSMKDMGFDDSTIKKIPNDGIITKERLEQIDKVYKGIIEQGADIATADIIRAKMLTQ